MRPSNCYHCVQIRIKNNSPNFIINLADYHESSVAPVLDEVLPFHQGDQHFRSEPALGHTFQSMLCNIHPKYTLRMYTLSIYFLRNPLSDRKKTSNL